MGNLSPHFDDEEFRCIHCGTLPKQGIDKRLIQKLEALRSIFGKPIHINSGYRCAKHNRQVGGATLSQHRYGRAADIVVVADIPISRVYDAADRIFAGVGKYSSFTHVDVRSWQARWDGRRKHD